MTSTIACLAGLPVAARITALALPLLVVGQVVCLPALVRVLVGEINAG